MYINQTSAWAHSNQDAYHSDSRLQMKSCRYGFNEVMKVNSWPYCSSKNTRPNNSLLLFSWIISNLPFDWKECRQMVDNKKYSNSGAIINQLKQWRWENDCCILIIWKLTRSNLIFRTEYTTSMAYVFNIIKSCQSWQVDYIRNFTSNKAPSSLTKTFNCSLQTIIYICSECI